MKWAEVKFSDVAEIVTGNTPPKKDAEIIVLVYRG